MVAWVVMGTLGGFPARPVGLFDFVMVIGGLGRLLGKLRRNKYSFVLEICVACEKLRCG